VQLSQSPAPMPAGGSGGCGSGTHPDYGRRHGLRAI